ncbi:hypothetical protein [uncultured Clostridium sp.]|uniref:hypothetical protein n=1 Tax=uncultured Clostridium sp. TaxID=59620 RepID=UPI00272A938F|nr:hypothetical protein [uncultured Clostridium sp.]
MVSSEEIRKLIFMNYKEILEDFRENNIKTKAGKEVTHKDLRTAILIMLDQHPSCRWQSEKIKKRYYYLQYEAVIWLREVYFNNYEIKFIDKDIKWFEERIKWYIDTLEKNNIKYPQIDYHLKPMTKRELTKYFDRGLSSIQQAIIEMEQITNCKNRNYKNGTLQINEVQIEWLLKNKFKTKYLQLLEEYKMVLTEIFKANGGYYDNYFDRN